MPPKTNIDPQITPDLIGIIADIHNKVDQAEAIIQEIEKNPRIKKVILLGDYFDDFHDSPSLAKKTALWLKQSLENPKRLHLYGNHDLAYFYPWNQHLLCPGWEINKQKEISKILGEQEIEKFKPHCLIKKDKLSDSPTTLISHAGISIPSLYGILNPEDIEKGGRLEFLNELSTQEHLEKLEVETPSWQRSLQTGDFHFLMTQGTRVGQKSHGGPQWLDWSNLTPIDNLNQIVGHSIVKSPEMKINEKSKNYCLDTNLKHFFILDPTSQELAGYTLGDSIDKEKYKIFWDDVSNINRNSKPKASWDPKMPRINKIPSKPQNIGVCFQ